MTLCNVKFESARNPVAYYELAYEEQTRTPSYAAGRGRLPLVMKLSKLYDEYDHTPTQALVAGVLVEGKDGRPRSKNKT